MLSFAKLAFFGRNINSKHLTASPFVSNSLFNASTMTTTSRHATIQVGLTGSIGMGKSTIANQLKFLGFPVFDADQKVHELYSSGGDAVEPISSLFPHVIENNAVCRTKLTKTIMNDPTALKNIEQIVHPLVINARKEFYHTAAEDGHFMVFHDIPLLFENRAKYDVDYTLVVTANAELQRERVLNREGMTAEKFESILSRQMSDSEKRKLADFVIHTDYAGYSEGRAQLAKVIESIINGNPEKWNAWKLKNSCCRDDDPSALSSSPLPTAPVAVATTGSDIDSSGSDTSAIHAVSSSQQQLHSQRQQKQQPQEQQQGGSQSVITRSAFDMLLFDLDDTLAPTKKQLSLAYVAMNAYMETYMPETCKEMKDNFVEVAKRLKATYPLIAHDLMELRHRGMHQIAAKYDEEQYLDGAIEAFLTARNNIEPNLFHDVMSCLEWAKSQGFKIGILTNGSANLDKCLSLKPFIDLYFTAADVGAAKPSPVGFIAAVHKAGVLPSRVLYVGDSYEHDVLGANNVGMHSALLLRKAVFKPPVVADTQNQTTAAMADSAVAAATPTSPSTVRSEASSNGVAHDMKVASTTAESPVTEPSQLESATGLIVDHSVDDGAHPESDYPAADVILSSLEPEDIERKVAAFMEKKRMNGGL